MAEEKIHKASSFLQAKDVPFFYFLYLNEMKKFFKIEDFWKGSNH
jgi:hypothetical protein